MEKKSDSRARLTNDEIILSAQEQALKLTLAAALQCKEEEEVAAAVADKGEVQVAISQSMEESAS